MSDAALNFNYESIFPSLLGDYFTRGNQVTVLRNGDEIFGSMIEAIESAQESVDFLTYIYWAGKVADRFAKALIEKSRQGVRVRILLDSFGARFISKKMVKRFRQNNIDVMWFRRVFQWRYLNHRMHRKLLICDKKIAFTGGVGIAEQWRGKAKNSSEWRETHFKLSGPIVQMIQSAFVENWYEVKNEPIDLVKEVVPYLPHLEQGVMLLGIKSQPTFGLNKFYITLQTLLRAAQKSIQITMPYFVPNAQIIEIFADLRKRHVNIDIIVPGKYIDVSVSKYAGEYYYDTLLKMGVNIYNYQTTMIHSKIMVIDDILSCIGSGNFNQRSMRRDSEINLIILDKFISDELKKDFYQDLACSIKLEYKKWLARSRFRKMLEAITHFFLSEDV